jgi:diguanylate cyclase (GGDEF)-like protein
MLLASTRECHRDGTVRATQHSHPAGTRFDFSRRAVTAAFAGVLLSLVAAFAVGRWESSVADVEFAGAAKNQAIILQNGVNEYLSRLVALKTLFESANKEVTRSEFELFISRLFEDHPGLVRVSWIPRVERKERPDYEKAAVEDGIVGYQFRSLTADGVVVPAPESDEYYPVFYSTEPKTAAVYGFNVASDPVRRATTERARDNDAIATLPAHGRYVQAGNPNGVLVSIPVYAKGTSRDLLADRRRNISGFISGVFELARLLDTIIATTAPSSGVDLQIYSADGSLAAQSINGGASASSTSWLREKLLDAVAPGPRWSGTLRIGDADWRLSSTPAARSRLAARFDRALIVFIAGLAVTATIFAYICFTKRHDRAVELALTDALTGLANRRAFFERLNSVLAEARHGGGERGFAVLYLDLDHLKDVNDVLGHAAGDDLLRQVANRLRKILRQSDLGARFGGDEFAVLQHDVADGTSIEALAHGIREALAEPYHINGAVAHVTASIGIARSTPDLADADSIMMQADLALYRAKEDGRNCYRLHSGELGQQVRERVILADELRGAIERGELELHYQPQVELATGRILGLEALLRWRHPARGLVSPALFIPIAERNGSILQIGQWAFDEACRQYRAWDDDGIAPNVLAVNFSAVQFKATVDLESEIKASLKRWRIAPSHMEVELTESVLMEASEIRGGSLEKLRQAGLRIALSGFGTGYSSLSYLATCPVNRLKIARQIVSGAATEPHNAVVLRTAIRLARELGIEFLAEGVETLVQANFLVASGCEQAQGFYFSEPVTAARTTELLREGHIRAATIRPPNVLTAA